MSAAAIIVACLSGASFLSAIASGILWLRLSSQGAPGSERRFWLFVTIGCVVAGGLLAWAAWP